MISVRRPRRPPAPPDIRVRIEEVSARLARLTVDRRDPHRFFEERSDIAAELRRIAGDLPSPPAAIGEANG